MGIVLEYSHAFKSMNPEDTFDRVISWLKREGATKVKENRPYIIEATHGSMKNLFGWQRNGKKRMIFTFQSTSEWVYVKVKVIPSMLIQDDIRQMYSDANINWGLLMEECWASVEGGPTTEEQRNLSNAKIALTKTNMEQGRKMLRYGLAGMFLLLVFGFTFIYYTHASIIGIFIFSPAVFLGLTAFWGFMRMHSK